MCACVCDVEEGCGFESRCFRGLFFVVVFFFFLYFFKKKINCEPTVLLLLLLQCTVYQQLNPNFQTLPSLPLPCHIHNHTRLGSLPFIHFPPLFMFMFTHARVKLNTAQQMGLDCFIYHALYNRFVVVIVMRGRGERVCVGVVVVVVVVNEGM